MKFDIVKSFIAIAISALIAYGCYSLYEEAQYNILFVIVTFLFLAVTSIFSIGVSSEYPRTSVMVKTTSWVFFFIGIALAIGFALMGFSKPALIITNGVILLIYILIINSIWKTKQ